MVIYRAADGRTITSEDLVEVSGPFPYEVLGRPELPSAESLHAEARRAGASGDYKRALELLAEAATHAPLWPYPLYDMAFTHLLMGDAAQARASYEKTLELSPRGYFTALTALDTLEREAAGEFPSNLYLAYVSLEWAESPEARTDAVQQLIDHVPGFAPGWKEAMMLVESDEDMLEMIERGLAAHPDGETEGILLINQALAIERSGERESAIQLLGELALDPSSTFGTEHFAKVALASILGEIELS